MKSISKNIHKGVKGLFFAGLLLISLTGIGQNKSVILDPKLGRIELTDLVGNQVDENYVQPQQLIKLKIPVGTVTHGLALPAGSCKIKIGFGSKLILDPAFDMNTVTLSNYFKWTAVLNGGQQQITGELVSALPENFQEVAVAFKVKGTAEGSSTITANFLITNHNTATILSDEDGSNNMSFLHYRVTSLLAPVPVTSISDVKRSDCSINILFGTDKEINLQRYEIELSKDAVSYVKAGEVSATNLSSYTNSVVITKELESRVLYVRIKSIFADGRIAYSNVKTIDGTCSTNWKLDIFPNPASNVKSVVIRAVEGIFNGKYMISTVDMAGKKINVKELQLDNVLSFKYEFSSGLAAGKYLVKVVNSDGSQSAILTFEKL